jgi:unsaturated rhamnogalacturonyl hydrolase
VPIIHRRNFLQLATLVAGALAPAAVRGVAPTARASARHLPATLVSHPGLPRPPGLRPPFGWRLVTVGQAQDAPVVLQWPEISNDPPPTFFRVAVGLDERDEKVLEVVLPRSGRAIGTMELRRVSQFQVYQLPLGASDVRDISREGLALRLLSGSPLELFAGGDDLPDALLPHLLVPGTADATTEFFARLDSVAVVQQFGWMLGCVLDGLLDLAELPRFAHLRQMAARQHASGAPAGSTWLPHHHLTRGTLDADPLLVLRHHLPEVDSRRQAIRAR